jgi:FkbM family methyltransferase
VSLQHYRITYAQNREDLILAGILRKVENGFYVDVGANHPEHDSVTKIFYDKGWSGINVEPQQHLIRELERQRPRDINIQAGVAAQPGTLMLRFFENADELSTFSAELKQMYDSQPSGYSYREISIEVRSLEGILQQHRPAGDIHFLKIDAEGMELEVLLGNAWGRFRPWIICLEQSINGARTAAIGAFLGAWNYAHVFFDGINDYFVAGERRALWDEFSYAREIIMPGIALYAGLVAHLTPAATPASVPAAPAPVSARVEDLLALDGEAFVRGAYAAILGRTPDADGLSNYLAELNSGVRKEVIVSRLRESEEARRRKLSPGQ